MYVLYAKLLTKSLKKESNEFIKTIQEKKSMVDVSEKYFSNVIVPFFIKSD